MPALLSLLLLLCLAAPAAAEPAPPASSARPVEGAWLSPVALSDPADPTSLAAPERLLLVIYNHGSRAEFRRDRCRPEPARPDATTPAAVAGLAGEAVGGLKVAVFAFCTAAGYGDFEADSGEGEPKVVKRAAEIAALAARFAAAGVPPRRIVLAGQSAGGWAALLAAAGSRLPLGGVLAFAPAFAGEAEDRAPAWQRLRDAQAAGLAAAALPPALVYGFPGDPYEPPADLGFLAAVPGVEVVAPAAGCTAPRPHLTAFAGCFAAAERTRLLGFLAARARPAGGA